MNPIDTRDTQFSVSTKQLWFGLAGLLLVIGLSVMFFHTGPKLMGAGGETAGASVWDLFGSWGPLVGALVAFIGALRTGNVSAIVSSAKAIAADPHCHELMMQAETVMLLRIKEFHSSHPAVQDAISLLMQEISKANFPSSTADLKSPGV